MQYRIFILCIFLFIANLTFAQVTVSGDFRNKDLIGVIKTIEKQTSWKVYYKNTDIDSLKVDIIVNNMPIERFVDTVMKQVKLQYLIFEHNLYLTKDSRLFPNVKLVETGKIDAEETVTTLSNNIPVTSLEVQKMVKATPTTRTYEIGNKHTVDPQIVLTGTIVSAKTGEPLSNVAMQLTPEVIGYSDQYGRYSFPSITSGRYSLNVIGAGMGEVTFELIIHSSGKFDIALSEKVETLKAVTIVGKRNSNVLRPQLGVERMSIETIKLIPPTFGEVDIIRAITSLPGVKTVGEASTGFNVRGGSADQNLILFNDATIYNPSHFFGMFSAFNPDVVKDVELYKSSMPAKFGGRLASVLDINSREGNKKKVTGSAGIGLVTSRFHIEGPIANDKTSFILGGRTTYANWLMNLLPDEYKNSKASFHDMNLGISHEIDSTSNLYFSGYYSGDKFSLGNDTTYGYSNRNFSLKWKKVFNSRLTGIFTIGSDAYQYKVESKDNKVNAFAMKFNIHQLNAKVDFKYDVNTSNSFDFGLNTIRYKLNPGEYAPVGEESAVAHDVLQAEQALESAVYLAHNYRPNNQLTISTGLRYSMFNYLGKRSVNYYRPGEPTTDDNLIDVVNYGNGKLINTYGAPEFRFSMRYALSNSFSLKAGVNSQQQYIHMLSNTAAISPTDIWKLSDPNIKPQQGYQFSLGAYKDILDQYIEASVEVYYKRIKNYLDYKPGATLIMNHKIEQDVLSTRGKAYGVELMLKRTAGKVNGWLSYTYSRILLQANQATEGVMINQGAYYPANYDKPHDATLLLNYKVSHRFNVSVNSTYSTGRPITLPVGKFFYLGSERVLYSDRNQYRIPDYLRMDFSMNIEGNHKVNKKTHNSWTIGAYNFLGRRNPYSVFYISEGGSIQGYKLSIFGSAIPFISYNIKF